MDVSSQPEVYRGVRVSHALPHPREELGLVGGEVVVGLAVGPCNVTVGGSLARFAQSAGHVTVIIVGGGLPYTGA